METTIDRSTEGRQTRAWDSELQIGGLVSFHEWEAFKDWGKEVRKFVWYKDVGKYGLGNITMVLRYGYFDPDEEDWIWHWHEDRAVDLFILNTRGSSWR